MQPLLPSILAAAIAASAAMPAFSADSPQVIAVVTFKLKPGVTATVAPGDKAVADQHVSKQTGLISRESAAGDDGTWLVIVHWAIKKKKPMLPRQLQQRGPPRKASCLNWKQT